MYNRARSILKIIFVISLCLTNLPHAIPQAIYAQSEAENESYLSMPEDRLPLDNQLFIPFTVGPIDSGSTDEPAESQSSNEDPHKHDDYSLAKLAREHNEPPFVSEMSEAAATGPLTKWGNGGQSFLGHLLLLLL